MQNASIHTIIQYNSLQNGYNTSPIHMIMIDLSYLCSSFVWILVAYVLIFGTFSVHYKDVSKFFILV